MNGYYYWKDAEINSQKSFNSYIKIGRADYPSNFTALFNIFNWILSDLFVLELTLSIVLLDYTTLDLLRHFHTKYKCIILVCIKSVTYMRSCFIHNYINQ